MKKRYVFLIAVLAFGLGRLLAVYEGFYSRNLLAYSAKELRSLHLEPFVSLSTLSDKNISGFNPRETFARCTFAKNRICYSLWVTIPKGSEWTFAQDTSKLMQERCKLITKAHTNDGFAKLKTAWNKNDEFTQIRISRLNLLCDLALDHQQVHIRSLNIPDDSFKSSVNIEMTTGNH